MKKHDKINIYCVFFQNRIYPPCNEKENAVGENIRRLRMRNQLKQAILLQNLISAANHFPLMSVGITLPDIYLLRDCRFFSESLWMSFYGRITIH